MGLLGLLVPGVGMGGGTAVPSATGPVTPIVRVPTTDDVIWRPVAEPVTATLDARIHAQVDDRIVESPAGSYLPIWSNYDHERDAGVDPAVWSVPEGGFVLNADCWAAGLNFFGVGTFITSTHFFGATLISPRHVIAANHAGLSAGKEIHFIRADGSVYDATVASSQQVTEGMTADIEIGYLEEDADVDFYRVLPKTFDDFLTYDETDMAGIVPPPTNPTPTGLSGKPFIVLDQLRKALIGRLNRFTIAAVNTTIVNGIYNDGNTKYPNRDDYWLSLNVLGNSSWPTFLLVDGELVLIGVHINANGAIGWNDSAIQHQDLGRPSNFDAINTVMNTLQGANSSYQLATKSLLTPSTTSIVGRVPRSSAGVIRRV